MSQPFNSDRHAINWLRAHVQAVEPFHDFAPDGERVNMVNVMHSARHHTSEVRDLISDAVCMLRDNGWKVNESHASTRARGIRGVRGSVSYDEVFKTPSRMTEVIHSLSSAETIVAYDNSIPTAQWSNTPISTGSIFLGGGGSGGSSGAAVISPLRGVQYRYDSKAGAYLPMVDSQEALKTSDEMTDYDSHLKSINKALGRVAALASDAEEKS